MKHRSADIFFSSNVLKILGFLIDRPGKDFTTGEIQKEVLLSRTGVFFALRTLAEKGLVSKAGRGKFFVYSAIHTEPVVKQYKVVKNILDLDGLLERLKPVSKRVVLFGSAQRGEDTPQRDIDLFIVSSDPDQVREVLAKTKSDRKIQPVVLTPAQVPDFQEKEKVFYREVERGITLWENTDER